MGRNMAASLESSDLLTSPNNRIHLFDRVEPPFSAVYMLQQSASFITTTSNLIESRLISPLTNNSTYGVLRDSLSISSQYELKTYPTMESLDDVTLMNETMFNASLNCNHTEYSHECQNAPLTSVCNLRYSLSWTVVLFVAYLIVFFIGLLGNLSVLWIVYGLKGEHHGRRRHSCVTSNVVGGGYYSTTNHTLSHSVVSQPQSQQPQQQQQQQGATTIVLQQQQQLNGKHTSPKTTPTVPQTLIGTKTRTSQRQPSQHYQPVGKLLHQSKVQQQHQQFVQQPPPAPIIYINRSNIVFYRFVSNLAVADLLVLIFCLPPTLIGNVYFSWILGRFVCKAVPYLQGVSVSASVYTLVAISIDRFYAIYYPLSKKCSKGLCWITIALIWGWSFGISLPWLMYFEVTPVCDNLNVCRDTWPSKSLEKSYFLVVNVGLQYLIPLSVIAFFYILILKKIAHRKLPKLARHLPSNVADGNRQASLVIERSKVKVFKMLIVLVLLFALSWLPLYLIFFQFKFGLDVEENSISEHVLETMIPVAQWLGASNSCVNPILYFFFNAKFRAYYRESWLNTFSCCLWWCPIRGRRTLSTTITTTTAPTAPKTSSPLPRSPAFRAVSMKAATITTTSDPNVLSCTVDESAMRPASASTTVTTANVTNSTTKTTTTTTTTATVAACGSLDEKNSMTAV